MDPIKNGKLGQCLVCGKNLVLLSVNDTSGLNLSLRCPTIMYIYSFDNRSARGKLKYYPLIATLVGGIFSPTARSRSCQLGSFSLAAYTRFERFSVFGVTDDASLSILSNSL